MTTIWKYELTDTKNIIEIPEDSKILTVKKQHDKLCLWTIGDSDNEKEERIFMVYGTGWKIKEDINKLFYIDTFFEQGESLVFHVFEYILK